MPAPKALARKSPNSAVLVSVKAFWKSSTKPPRRMAAPATAHQADFLRGDDSVSAHPPKRVRHPYAIACKNLSHPSIFGSGTGGAGSIDNQKMVNTQTSTRIRLHSLDVIIAYRDIVGIFTLGVSIINQLLDSFTSGVSGRKLDSAGQEDGLFAPANIPSPLAKDHGNIVDKAHN
jgi:hypothetical protein